MKRIESSHEFAARDPTFPIRGVTIGARVGSQFVFPNFLQALVCLLICGGGRTERTASNCAGLCV